MKGTRLVLISIGKPEKGKELLEHLGFNAGGTYLYVDPENSSYNSLHFNRGIETLVTMGTSFSFLNRFTRKGGMKELNEVLLKWNKAFIVPPKLEQGFFQGGTFIFDGPKTVFAHYDESTGAHADIGMITELLSMCCTKS